MAIKTRATIEDLNCVPENGKAELVNGELVRMPPTGGRPARAGGMIYIHLRQYELRTKSGYAFPDNTGFIVKLPNRESFSPDAAYYVGPGADMKFVQGAPIFAAEVRSEGDCGLKAEREMAAKRADYFAAGTQVVWDVDLQSAEVVRKYTAADPITPIVFRRGEIADAEPALPGWKMPIDDLFE
jgi:Uma2 family endonuclease